MNAQLPADRSASAAPWDALPADHYVAYCDYTPPTTDNPTTTLCPNGTPPSGLSVTGVQNYFVDEDGRFSAATTSNECG